MKILSSDKVIDSIKLNDTMLVEDTKSGYCTVMLVNRCTCGCRKLRLIDVQSGNKRLRRLNGCGVFFESLDGIKSILKSKKYYIL